MGLLLQFISKVKKLEQFVEKNYDLSVDFIKANKLEQFFQE